VKSKKNDLISSKLIFKPKGPYRVVDRAGDESYILQKIPFIEGQGQHGHHIKESSAHIECLPSTLCIHKKMDGTDTHFAAMEHGQAIDPVQHWLGISCYGTY
jgi:hypothetical protein